MLKDLLLSIATPFSQTRYFSKSFDEEFPSVFDSDKEEFSPAFSRRRTKSLNQRPSRRGSVSSRKCNRKKSISFLEGSEREQMLSKIKKTSSHLDKNSPINILVVGAKNVGKSALTVRFITKRYIGEYMSGEKKTYNYISAEEKQQTIVFLDESNDDDNELSTMSQLSEENLSWADGIMLVYDVGDISTFNYAKEVIKFITEKLSNHHHDVMNSDKTSNLFWKTKLDKEFKPILMIGNKTDLVKRRRVSENDVKKAAEEFPPWVMCNQLSAAEDCDNVVKSVNELISNIRRKRRFLYGLSAKENLKNIVGNVRHRAMKVKSRRVS